MQRFIFIFALLVAAGCTTTKTLPEVNYMRPYDREAHYLHPVIGLYHLSGDSSQVMIEISPQEFLLSRSNAQEAFSWKVGLEARVRTAGDSILAIEKWDIDMLASKEEKVLLTKNIAAPKGKDLHLLVIVTDKSRNVEDKQVLRFDKSDQLTRESFLLLSEDGKPHLDHAVNKDSTYSIACSTCDTEGLRVHQSAKRIALPPPPHSGNKRAVPSLEESSYTNIASLNDFGFKLRDNWAYVGPSKPEDGRGIYIREQTISYPEIEHFKTMSEATRYIATRKEYARIMESFDQHQAMDEFWLDCAGNNDRAKAMIKVFYKRVEEANTYFTDYQDGWKTDRGLIHIIYGNPTRVYKKKTEEVWIYGSSDDPSAPVFRFSRSFNPVVGYYYELQRSSSYKPDWDSLIQAWKNGRIYTG